MLNYKKKKKIVVIRMKRNSNLLTTVFIIQVTTTFLEDKEVLDIASILPHIKILIPTRIIKLPFGVTNRNLLYFPLHIVNLYIPDVEKITTLKSISQVKSLTLIGKRNDDDSGPQLLNTLSGMEY
jgi:hypothetical protein